MGFEEPSVRFDGFRGRLIEEKSCDRQSILSRTHLVMQSGEEEEVRVAALALGPLPSQIDQYI